MTNSENTLLIWVLSIAALLLAVLYSPLGSPDLYHPRKYFTENQGVNFNVTSISHGSKDVSSINSKVSSLKGNVESLSSVKNSPKGKTAGSNQDAELNVPNVSGKRQKQYQTSATSDSKAQSGSVAAARINKSGVAIRNSGIASTNNSNTSTNSAAGNGASGETASLGSNRSSNNSLNSQNSVLSGVSSNISSVDSTALLASNYSARKTSEFIDPAGDPLGDPVPIPEGWSCLALFAISYCIFIFFKKRKLKTSV